MYFCNFCCGQLSSEVENGEITLLCKIDNEFRKSNAHVITSWLCDLIKVNIVVMHDGAGAGYHTDDEGK